MDASAPSVDRRFSRALGDVAQPSLADLSISKAELHLSTVSWCRAVQNLSVFIQDWVSPVYESLGVGFLLFFY